MKLQLEIQLNLVRKLLPAGQEMKGSWNYYYLVLINIRRYKHFEVPKMGTFLQHQVCDDDCVRGKNSPLPASQTFTVEEFSYLQTSYINLKNFYQHLGSCFSWIPVGELSIIDWLALGSILLVRSSLMDSGKGGIWLIMPGVHLMSFRMAETLLLVRQKSSMLSCNLNVERLALIWLKARAFCSKRCLVVPLIPRTSKEIGTFRYMCCIVTG